MVALVDGLMELRHSVVFREGEFTADLRYVGFDKLYAYGSGGGGAGQHLQDGSGGAGGGGGGYSEVNDLVLVQGRKYYVFVGVGGTAGTAATVSAFPYTFVRGTSGGNGGNSYFGSNEDGVLLRAIGASGGTSADTPVAGVGGDTVAAVGDVKKYGGNGSLGGNTAGGQPAGGGGGSAGFPTVDGINGGNPLGGATEGESAGGTAGWRTSAEDIWLIAIAGNFPGGGGGGGAPVVRPGDVAGPDSALTSSCGAAGAHGTVAGIAIALVPSQPQPLLEEEAAIEGPLASLFALM